MAHELAWFIYYGEWPKHPVVHKNGIRFNNWITNLKLKPVKKKRKNNKSGVVGVSWDKRYKN